MCKISILFLDRDFEHDVYELVKSFYPGADIRTSYKEIDKECGLKFRIEKSGNSFLIRYDCEGHKGVAGASVIEGQSSDALICCSRKRYRKMKSGLMPMKSADKIRTVSNMPCIMYWSG